MSSAVYPFQEQQAPDEGINSPIPSGNSNPQPVSGVPAAYGIAPPGIAGHSYGAPPASAGGYVYFCDPPPENSTGDALGIPIYVYGAPHPGSYTDCAQIYSGGIVLGYCSGAPGYPIGGSNSAGYPVEPSSNSVITPSNLSSLIRASDDPLGSPGNPVYTYGAPQCPVGASDDPTSAGPSAGASGDLIEAPVTDNVAGYPVQVSPSDFAGAPGNAVGCAPSSPADAPPEVTKDVQSTSSAVGGATDFNYRPPVDIGRGHSLLKSAISQPPSQQPADPRNQIQTGRWAAGLCACCDDCVPNLCMPWCCPCISLAQIYARMGMQGYKRVVARLFLLYVVGLVGNFVPRTKSLRSSSSTSGGLYYTTGSTDASTATSSMATLIPTMIILAGQMLFRAHIWHVRSRIRQRFHIPGSACGDCCASCFCSCCTIAQLATHVKSYTPGSCDFHGPDKQPPCLYHF